jgi:hypothetical protein
MTETEKKTETRYEATLKVVGIKKRCRKLDKHYDRLGWVRDSFGATQDDVDKINQHLTNNYKRITKADLIVEKVEWEDLGNGTSITTMDTRKVTPIVWKEIVN